MRQAEKKIPLLKKIPHFVSRSNPCTIPQNRNQTGLGWDLKDRLAGRLKGGSPHSHPAPPSASSPRPRELPKTVCLKQDIATPGPSGSLIQRRDLSSPVLHPHLSAGGNHGAPPGVKQRQSKNRTGQNPSQELEVWHREDSRSRPHPK